LRDISGFYIRVLQSVDTFSPPGISLSNASTKSAILALCVDDRARNFFSLAGGKGIIRSARIYTYPDYPEAVLTQVGTAQLTPDGLEYHTYINGFTAGLPTDLREVRPYTQVFERLGNSTMRLTCCTEIISASAGVVRSQILGTFSFHDLLEMDHNLAVTYEPSFTVQGNETRIRMPVSLRAL
jgi:hypothetical protein